MVVKSSYPSVLKQHAVVYCLFFVDVFIKLLKRHQPYETHNIRPRPTISGPDIQYQAPKLSSDSGHVQSVFLPGKRAKFMNISINKMELNYFSPNCVLFHLQFVKYLAK